MQSNAPTAARYAAVLCELATDMGVDRGVLLHGTGLDERRLTDPTGFVSATELDRFLASFSRLTGETMPGLLLGERLNISAHGTIGFAGLTAANADEAVALACRYFELVSALVNLTLEKDSQRAHLCITPLADLNERLEHFILHAMLGSFSIMAAFLVDRLTFQVDLALPEQPHLVSRLGDSIERVRFNQPGHRFSIPAALLRVPFALADRAAHERALAQCDRELEALHRQRSFAERLYRELLVNTDAMPSIEQVADALHVSSRTVHRHLEQENTRFRDLVNAARVSKAKRLLLRDGLSITATAHQLGYQDSANFTRAFKRELGLTPSDFLQAQQERNEK